MTKNSTLSFEERCEDFHAYYGDDLDSGFSLLYLVISCGKYLAQIVGAEVANTGMSRIVEGLGEVYRPFTPEEAKTDKWAEIIEADASNAFTFLPLGASMHDLTAYAIYGITLDYEPGEAERTEKEREEFVEKSVRAAQKFWEESPFEKWPLADEHKGEFEELIMLTTNRWALDNDEPIEPRALAWFGGKLSEGTIRNLMSEGKLENVGGKISAQSARNWLDVRPDFYNSIWRHQGEAPTRKAPQSQPDDFADVLFVPVARDGSIFHPGLVRNGRFTIGQKGAEEKIEGFQKALVTLQHAQSANWRRPNESGNWGIVKGVRWERVSKDFLDTIANKPTYRLTGGQSA